MGTHPRKDDILDVAHAICLMDALLHLCIGDGHNLNSKHTPRFASALKTRKYCASDAVALYMGDECVKYCPPPSPRGSEGPLLTESAI